MMGFKGYYQISQTFTIGELTEHQSKQLVPTSEMLHIFVTLRLTDDVVELIPIQE
jgi:hypothetical protein